jgi:hypothetical protein
MNVANKDNSLIRNEVDKLEKSTHPHIVWWCECREEWTMRIQNWKEELKRIETIIKYVHEQFNSS